jgi:cation diffusion facilitator family transporter
MLNILLFAGKYFAGVISGSIAITADAFNNLLDAGSSVVMLVGFHFAGMKPDKEHPFGHGRVEYIAGFIVSVIILLMGFELGQSSVKKIIAPTQVDLTALSAVILMVSIAVKLYMFRYNRSISDRIKSSAMGAAATDSVSDAIATSVVLIAAMVSRVTGVEVDGWCGLLVALFILYSGYGAAKDTLSPLLGNPPSEEFVHKIEDIVMSSGTITGIHDLVVHDYGPGRVMVSLHGEVPADGDLLAMHDAVDLVEHRLRNELGCEAVIHMDPICTNDENVLALRDKIRAGAKQIDEGMDIHDFRVVKGPTHTNVIFDLVLPAGCELTDTQAREKISQVVISCGENFCAVVDIDHAYV